MQISTKTPKSVVISNESSANSSLRINHNRTGYDSLTIQTYKSRRTKIRRTLSGQQSSRQGVQNSRCSTRWFEKIRIYRTSIRPVMAHGQECIRLHTKRQKKNTTITEECQVPGIVKYKSFIILTVKTFKRWYKIQLVRLREESGAHTKVGQMTLQRKHEETGITYLKTETVGELYGSCVQEL